MIEKVTSYTAIKDFILEIEDKYPVDKWVYNDIPFWPHIRVKLYYALIQSVNNQEHQKVNKTIHVDQIGSSRLERLKRLWHSSVAFNKFLKGVDKRELLFMSLDMHKVIHNDIYFNRFFDSMIAVNDLEKNSFTFEIKKHLRPCYNQNAVETVAPYLDFYNKRYKITRFLYPLKNLESNNTQNVDRFREFLNNNGLFEISNQLKNSNLEKWSTKIRVFSNFYTRYLIKAKTKKVIAVSYYGFDSMWSCMHAANKLGIPTVDFQHGPQTEVHMAYASWSKIPKNGFSIMPKEYWCWDKESAQEINKWAIPVNTIAKVYGQPWLAFTQNENKKVDTSEKEPIVLYTLQTFPLFTLENTFTPDIIKLIENSKYKWILRLHPSNSQDSHLVESYLEENHVRKEKYTIQGPSDTPLPEVLRESLLHITNYSGCTIEARELGVKTILIDTVGLEVFKSYIDNDLVVFANKEEIEFHYKLERLILETVKNENLSSRKIVNPLEF
ncbi:hypothetical protein [Nonlabens sp. Asnod3-A02]|uniref:hypothetical protein n=1 Tax=Nonlabens sp. Asnod3-A02 TaxID=3160579 RepID=UPI003866E63D